MNERKAQIERKSRETEITAKLIARGYQIHEVPISYLARSKVHGKKITWCTALEMYWGIIKYKFFHTAI